MRPPEDAPSRYEPDGREEPGREDEDPPRDPPDEGLPDALELREPPDDGLPDEDLGDEERELLPPRPDGREPELLAGDISVPDFFSSSALFSCFVQHLACCWCYLCDFSMTYLQRLTKLGSKNVATQIKKGPPEGDPFLNNCPATSYSPTPSQVQYHRR